MSLPFNPLNVNSNDLSPKNGLLFSDIDSAREKRHACHQVTSFYEDGHRPAPGRIPAIEERVPPGQDANNLIINPSEFGFDSPELNHFVKFDLKKYNSFWSDVDRRRRALKSDRNIAKILLKERISGKSIFDGGGAAPYLEYNAQDRGDLQVDNIVDFKYQESLPDRCGKSAVWLLGGQTGRNYIKPISCRKAWCSCCGGKGGKIHKKRLSSVLTRVDVEKYNIQQLVLTVPAHLRHFFMNRENLEYLEKSAKHLTEKFFGVPVFDKKGHVRKYKLEVGVISNTHLFGEEKGIFKPHINIQVFPDKNKKLKIDRSKLESINKYWLKKLKIFDVNLEVVDVHFSFRDTPAKVMHAIKYMCRPWSSDDYVSIEDENLKRFLVLDLSGFRYIRFWGLLADRSYRDEMDISDIKKDCESKAGEKLIMLFVAPFDLKSWAPRLEEVDIGFYRVREKIIKGRGAPPLISRL